MDALDALDAADGLPTILPVRTASNPTGLPSFRLILHYFDTFLPYLLIMSSILSSGIAVTNIGGSLDDLTFSRNQWGPYVKGKSLGPGGGVPWLAAQQALTAAITNEWQTTTDDNRLLWIEAAGYSKNKVTKRIALKGFQLFMRVNINRNLCGNGSTMQPVPLVPLHILTSASITIAGGPGIDVFWGPAAPVGYFVRIYMSPWLSAGRMTPAVPFAFIDVDSTGAGTKDVTFPYVGHYGGGVPGQKIWVKIEVINPQTGQRSPAFFASGIW